MRTVTRRQWLGITVAGACSAGPRALLERWRGIASGTDGVVGAAVLRIGLGHAIALHARDRFPLASVCKVPIGMHILAMVDRAELRIDENIEILPRDVWPSWSGDLGDSWPRRRSASVHELLRLMLVHSDNTAVQVLYRIGGEARGMDESLRRWRIRGMRVDRYEGECALSLHGVTNAPPVAQWTPTTIRDLIARTPRQAQMRGVRKFVTECHNYATPIATVQLLAGAFEGKFLSRSGTSLLIELLEATATGGRRLKGLLPLGTVVAHKTGTTATIGGLTAATNDAGIILLPRNAGQLAVAVYVKASTRGAAARDRIIARIARAAYDRFAI